jgi:hypothetical protein
MNALTNWLRNRLLLALPSATWRGLCQHLNLSATNNEREQVLIRC